jgi:hypothetical protein
MARLPVPDRGQPLDVSYIYQIVEAVNELAAKTYSSTYKYSSIDTSSGTQNILVSDSKVVAAEVTIYATEQTVDAGKTEAFSYSFKSEYKYPPIVTATPVLISATNAGRDVTVVIERVTTSRVDGRIRFGTSGSTSLKVNLIAIGVPN